MTLTPERWQEVKRVLAAVLERAPSERASYLDETCTDPELRREVETLISAHESGNHPFVDPPTPTSAIPTAREFPAGTRIGSFEILGRLGSGGMGVVYKARDTKLGRYLALKCLPDGALAGEAARARLLREAQNASRLNHPNIATIYEASEDAGLVYIAMELVEGRPLRELIPRNGLTPEAAIRYGIQIAAALSHAHDRGIVHRDLKPSNVMVTSEGHLKVLDFGLAKRLTVSDLEEATRTELTLTESGTLVGTLQYMAPETLRGEEPDARTDIWALGVVLYEMTTGARPFQGRTSYELSSAILRETPAAFSANLPIGLQTVTQRCLAKEREQRYQRASEVRAALETISVERAVAAGASGARRTGTWIWIGAGFIAIVLTVAGIEWFRQSQTAPSPVSSESWTQITDFADSAISPALSADGRILAFIRGDDTFIGNGQIYAKVMPDGEPVQLTHDGMEKMSPQFSPDGSTIAYTVGTWDTWSVPVLGGDARLMLPNAEGLTWIDSGHLLFSEIKSGIHMAVVTATTTRSDSREIYVPPRERGMAHRSALSPDHKWVLLAEMDNGGWLPCRLVPFDGSSMGRTVGPQDAACTYVAWSPDQKWMYFSSDKGGRFHIWRQRFPDGAPRQVTAGATEEEGIAMEPDGKSLITSVGLRESTIWVHDEQGERQVSSEQYATNPEFSSDGLRVYYLVQPNGVSGEFVSGELWVTELANGRSQRLLPDTLVTGYDVSPDGTAVVYSDRDQAGRSSLWLASLDFRFSPRQFRSADNEDQPFWDKAGHIYFRAAEGKQNYLYRMNEDGSERDRVLANPILELFDVSPDGHWAAVSQTIGKKSATYIAPIGGGNLVFINAGYCVPRWSTDGKTFAVVLFTMKGIQTDVLPVNAATGIPLLPPTGLGAVEEVRNSKGAKLLEGPVILGPKPGLTVTQRQEVHRNLYRVPLQ